MANRTFTIWTIVCASVLLGLFASSWRPLLIGALVTGVLLNAYLMADLVVRERKYSKAWGIPIVAIPAGMVDAVKITLLGGIVFLARGLFA